MARKARHYRNLVMDSHITETTIAPGVAVKGNISSENDVRIDGLLDGNLKSKANILVGANAIIRGNVRGASITVAGHVEGNVSVDGTLNILETGKIVGDITTSSLIVTAGAYLNGGIKMVLEHSSEPIESE